ncbi:MAG: hypothetical protein WCG16_14660, partial [Methylococcales bacterium]
ARSGNFISCSSYFVLVPYPELECLIAQPVFRGQADVKTHKNIKLIINWKIKGATNNAVIY